MNIKLKEMKRDLMFIDVLAKIEPKPILYVELVYIRLR